MNHFNFEGKGFDFFKIYFVNTILITLSAGLLYPWAKVRELKYLFKSTNLAGNPFLFTGTTKQFFKGYIKTYLAIIFVTLFAMGGGLLMAWLNNQLLKELAYITTYTLYILYILYLAPYILHGSISYRLNHTLWGDIKWSYRGKLSKLISIYFFGLILESLTLGIYSAWLQVKFKKYLLQNTRFGDLRFDFSGDPKTLFLIYLKGFFLCMITLGIYGIWLTKNVYEYTVNNIVVKKDHQEFNLHSNANTLEVFEMIVLNFVIVVFTLGIGISWAYMRYYRFIFDHCLIPSDFNMATIHEPSEEEEEENTKKIESWLDRVNPEFIL